MMAIGNSIGYILVGTVLGGLVAGCGSKPSASPSQTSVGSAIVNAVSEQNMTSWNVQVTPLPLAIRALHVGQQATNPTLVIYTKRGSQDYWQRLLSSTSGSILSGQDALSVTWPTHAPQFYGEIKVALTWSVGHHQYSGNKVFSITPLKTHS